MDTSNTKKRFSKTGLWQLFIATAFPLHVWAIVLILMDLSWIAERTNYWDAIGVASYGLMFALFESLIFFTVLVLIGFVLPKSWKESKRVSLLGTLLLVTAIWAMIGQLYFLLELSFPPRVIQFLVGQEHPLWFLYGGFFLVVAPTVFLAAYFAAYSEKYQKSFLALIDRLSPLMGLYIFLDLVGIVIVIVRNLG